MTTKGYDIYKNGKYLGFVPGQNKKTRLETIKNLMYSTHMGQWIKTDDSFEYATTIGVYLKFKLVKRMSDVLNNYSIDFENSKF